MEGFEAIKIIAINEANCEALRPFIPALVNVLERHDSTPEVTEAGLATVVCILCIVYALYSIYLCIRKCNYA